MLRLLQAVGLWTCFVHSVATDRVFLLDFGFGVCYPCFTCGSGLGAWGRISWPCLLPAFPSSCRAWVFLGTWEGSRLACDWEESSVTHPYPMGSL
jgi:hypothetical protein